MLCFYSISPHANYTCQYSGSVNFTFFLEKGTESDDITTDAAKNHLETALASNVFIIIGPDNTVITYAPGTFVWRYVDDDSPVTPQGAIRDDDDDDDDLHPVYIIAIVCGTFIALVVLIALFVCCCSSRSVASAEGHQYYC